jgi:hypothetical protein
LGGDPKEISGKETKMIKISKKWIGILTALLVVGVVVSLILIPYACVASDNLSKEGTSYQVFSAAFIDNTDDSLYISFEPEEVFDDYPGYTDCIVPDGMQLQITAITVTNCNCGIRARLALWAYQNVGASIGQSGKVGVIVWQNYNIIIEPLETKHFTFPLPIVITGPQKINAHWGGKLRNDIEGLLYPATRDVYVVLTGQLVPGPSWNHWAE